MKQTAKGAAASMATAHRLIWLAGDFNMERDEGSTRFSDLSKFGNLYKWLNSQLGSGEPSFAGTSEELAWLLWIFHGAETVTPITGPPAAQKHTFVPSTGRGHWSSFVRRLGVSEISRQQHVDCLITRLAVEMSTGQKDVRVGLRVLSLDPANVPNPDADPSDTIPTEKVLNYVEGATRFTVDTVVYRGQSACAFTLDEDLQAVYGDDTNPFDLVPGTPSLGLSVTLLFDQATRQMWNTKVYGSATPAAGTKPLKTLSALGSYGFDLQQKDAVGVATGVGFVGAFPNVDWTIPNYPGPALDGGAPEIVLAGVPRQVGGTPAYTLDVKTPNAIVAFTT
jgi:hypothetical protein